MNNLSSSLLASPTGLAFLNLALAFVLGMLIGIERQYRQRTAGLRTNVLVCLGAAMFVNMATHFGVEGTARVVSYVVSGIGFLGAGVILRNEGNIHGINTAATLWGGAAIGACCGAGFYAEALIGTIFILAANTLLRPFVNFVNRRPAMLSSVDTDIDLHLVTNVEHQKEVLTLIQKMLFTQNILIEDIDIESFGDKEVEIKLQLNAYNIKQSHIDDLVDKIKRNPHINQVFWGPNLSD
ncbi:MAG: MgtC/SapB family protein [Neisseriaceae bacterium]|nr:MgtC/SapB family protein [Neisseriaceae bacterium]